MDEYLLCSECSTRFSAYEDHCPTCGQLFCLECGLPVSSESNYCPSCGKDLPDRCPSCDRQVGTGAIICGRCGYLLQNRVRTIVPEYTRIRLNRDSTPEIDSEKASECPSCGEVIFLEDGLCSACGQLVCVSCGHTIGEDDERCGHCGALLYFDCPLCGFELTTNSSLCPNCNALFPSECPKCHVELEPGLEHCHHCHRPLNVQRRNSARTIRSFIVGDSLVRMVACPKCGRNFDPSLGPCSRCETIVCPDCLLIMEKHEVACVKCSWIVNFDAG